MGKSYADAFVHDGYCGWLYSSVSDEIFYFYGALFVVGVGHSMRDDGGFE